MDGLPVNQDFPHSVTIGRGYSPEELLISYRCPYCSSDFEGSALQQPAGVGGGTYCPNCQERVRLSFPYARLAVVLSVLIAFGALFAFQVRSVIWLILGTALLWIPISLFLNTYFARFKPPVLKAWKPRRRTFFERMYERDSTPDLFNKRR